MRFLLRLVMTLVGIAGFFVMLAGGALWAYGQYGTPLVASQLEIAETDIEDALEDEYPGAEVTVDFEEVYYRFEGTSFYVAFKVHAIAEVGDTEVANETTYAALDLVGMITGGADFEMYEESEWTAVADQYKEAPSLVFDGEEAMSTGITVGIVGAAAFVGSIIIKAVFLRRKLT